MKLNPGAVAVVTGGASGIGFALCEALYARGLKIVVADIEEPALEAALAQFSDDRAIGVRTDVSKLEDVIALRDAALARFGRIDLVVNNAGVFSRFAPMWEIEMVEWKWVIDVNLWGVIHGINVFVPTLIAQGEGHIVNVSSLAGLISLPGNAAYNAAKHGVTTLTEGLKQELDQAGANVGVTLCCPGLVATNISFAARNRPAALTPANAPPQHAVSADERPLSATEEATQPMAPSLAADRIIAAVEANRLYCATHSGFPHVVRQRVDPLLAGVAVI